MHSEDVVLACRFRAVLAAIRYRSQLMFRDEPKENFSLDQRSAKSPRRSNAEQFRIGTYWCLSQAEHPGVSVAGRRKVLK